MGMLNSLGEELVHLMRGQVKVLNAGRARSNVVAQQVNVIAALSNVVRVNVSPADNLLQFGQVELFGVCVPEVSGLRVADRFDNRNESVADLGLEPFSSRRSLCALGNGVAVDGVFSPQIVKQPFSPDVTNNRSFNAKPNGVAGLHSAKAGHRIFRKPDLQRAVLLADEVNVSRVRYQASGLEQRRYLAPVCDLVGASLIKRQLGVYLL